jgi:pilus assembly protein FimV
VTPFVGVVLVAVVVIGNPALAVTLGQAKVLSYLNQPLNIEIPLIGVAPGQEDELRLRLANQGTFDRLGISYTRLLASMQFDIVQDNGEWIVRATTSRPVNEPFLDFPLLMAWPGGQMIRQYTLLLDPPGRPAPVVSKASVTPAAQPAARPTRQPAVAPPSPGAGSIYGPVQRGETLWPIAKKLKPSGITTRQMAMALLRANPQAFIDGNVNRLRAGARLTIPTRSFIEEMDAATAKRAFTEQVRRWRAPVATSPRAVEQAPPPVTQPPVPATKAPTDVTTDTRAPAPTTGRAEDDVQLRIVADKDKAAIEEGSDQDIKDQLLVTMEEVESNRITTDAIEARLERMEAELSRLQKLVELKDAQILALQSEVSAQEEIRAAAQQAEPQPPQPARPELPAAVEDAAKSLATAPKAAAVQQPANEGITTRIEAAPPVAAAPAKPLHEQYAWLAWVLLGLAGLSALILMFRRSEQEQAIASLPAAEQALDDYQASAERAAPAPAETRATDRRRAGATTPGDLTEPEESIELPPLSDTEAELDIESIMDQLAEERAQESAKSAASARTAVADKPSRQAPPADSGPAFDDDDIASWVAELESGADRSRSGSGSQSAIEDDDLPSILTELDDQLKHAREPVPPTASSLSFESVDDTIPVDELGDADSLSLDQPLGREQLDDDTFTMSLDLARAYLEIGDQDGARDMLHQALAVAEDPEQREKIETLLRQIG